MLLLPTRLDDGGEVLLAGLCRSCRPRRPAIAATRPPWEQTPTPCCARWGLSEAQIAALREQGVVG